MKNPRHHPPVRTERALNRREFLAGAVAGAAALGLGPALAGCATTPDTFRSGFKISLAEWSLHRALFARQLDHLDFPRTAQHDYGIEAVELVNQFFKDKAQNRNYLAELKRRADDQSVRLLLIMVDDEGALGDPDAAGRRQAVRNHFKWIEAAHTLGCHSIRVNAEARNQGTPEAQQDRVAESLHELAQFATDYRLNVLVENHGGLSSYAPWVAGLMRKVNLPNCGTLPDFGNFTVSEGKDYDRYRGVAEMMPWAAGVSAKSYDFDEAGWEIYIDYRRMLRIVLAARYHGHIGIEYEGKMLSEPNGIRATQRLLERLRTELTTQA
jgi:L-ribulose-5-phosphate 3-epimerase